MKKPFVLVVLAMAVMFVSAMMTSGCEPASVADATAPGVRAPNDDAAPAVLLKTGTVCNPFCYTDHAPGCGNLHDINQANASRLCYDFAVRKAWGTGACSPTTGYGGMGMSVLCLIGTNSSLIQAGDVVKFNGGKNHVVYVVSVQYGNMTIRDANYQGTHELHDYEHASHYSFTNGVDEVYRRPAIQSPVFTTTLNSPANGVELINTSVNFTWTSPGATEYQVQFDNESSFSSPYDLLAPSGPS